MENFAPNCATTGIGSVPFSNAGEGASFIIESGISIPFWPQIPALGFREQMIPQYAPDMPCVRLDADDERVVMDTSDKYGELERFYEKFLTEDPARFPMGGEAAGLAAFKRAADGRKWPVVKGHVTGPVTMTTGIKDGDNNLLYADEELRQAAADCLARKAQWQIEELRPFADDAVLIFIDEPVLAAYGSSALLGISEKDVLELEGKIIEAIASAGGISGIHVCGNSDWGVVIRTGVDVVSFDAYEFGTTPSLYPDDVRALMDRGGVLAWGIVPTSDVVKSETPASLAARLDDGLKSLENQGLERDHIIRQSLLTPSCGTGSLSPELARRVFELLVQLQI